MLGALTVHKRVSVKSGNGPGKGYCAAVAVLWFLYSHGPAIVLSTRAHPSDRCATSSGGRFGRLHRRAAATLGGKMLDTRWELADYVVKPFSPTELAARIRAALRKRAAPDLAQPSEPYVRGELTIDYPRRRVTVAGRPVALTVIEYRMLVELSANAGRALTHEHLLQRVWGPDKGEDSGPVRNIVKRLRRKLGDDASNPVYIFAEPRVGYRMEQGEGQEQEDGLGQGR